MIFPDLNSDEFNPHFRRITTLENDPSIVRDMRLGLYVPQGELAPMPQTWIAHICKKMQLPAPTAHNWQPYGTLRAYINESRWLVDCPFGCGFSMQASKVQPLFWCPKCQMKRNQRFALRIVFPTEPILSEIETALLMRPDYHTRNWRPHETVAQLAKENLEHKDELSINEHWHMAIMRRGG